ncbi:uncharacterized protein LOC108666756 [Hyalella azteca]|uniref:Uncharacterized protein LOC108666756 n=1 Tax=Hyalella azteca TaxID=294128 RepID=A0A8B7N6C6_HYAAZ|nr:uncharacterized protein LOC108666756 [Hyalella azteca]XP_018009171.1 uncharacterized protein LOC108666756 [Hyalella azteca]
MSQLVTTPPTPSDPFTPDYSEYEENLEIKDGIPTPDTSMELDILESVRCFFLMKDESRRRTVFELSKKNGPLLWSTIEPHSEGNFCGCCVDSCSCQHSQTRLLFDYFGPVLQMVEVQDGCCSRRMLEVTSLPNTYLGSVMNTSAWWRFGLTVTDHEDNPIYYIGQDRSRGCCSLNDYRIVCWQRRKTIGFIYRRRDFGYRIGFNFHMPIDLLVTDKALLVAAVFFLDAVTGEDKACLGCCFF